MAEVRPLHDAPVTYAEAIEAYLTAAGISASSRRIGVAVVTRKNRADLAGLR